MPTYIGLINYTQDGIDQFENHSDRLDAATDAMEELGGELIAYYNTLGQYDAVAIGEFPDADTALMNSVLQAKQGTVRVETLRAFDQDETEQIIEQLPD